MPVSEFGWLVGSLSKNRMCGPVAVVHGLFEFSAVLTLGFGLAEVFSTACLSPYLLYKKTSCNNVAAIAPCSFRPLSILCPLLSTQNSSDPSVASRHISSPVVSSPHQPCHTYTGGSLSYLTIRNMNLTDSGRMSLVVLGFFENHLRKFSLVG